MLIKDILKAKESFISDFRNASSLGYIPSRRKHNTGIGKTFEDIMEIEENNSSIADYKGLIELKSQRSYTESMISLFTKSPTYPKAINTKLRESYGVLDPNTGYKKLHTTISHSQYNSYNKMWGFKLEINDEEERIELKIKNLTGTKHENTTLLKFFVKKENSEYYEKIPEDEDLLIYWSFDELIPKIEKKCRLIAYITAETRKSNGLEEFHFRKAVLLSGLTFEKFIEAIRADKILVDIRIGSYRSGPNKGKVHDHGTGFRIKRSNLSDVFEIEEIEHVLESARS